MTSVEEKSRRLYYKSFLKVVRNSVGSDMFRNFYVETPGKGEFDALDDGGNSCAFYVSCVLVIFKKISAVHGLVGSVVEDLKKSGWIEVKQPKAGDVLVWEAQEFPDGLHEHIGFYVGNNRAVSTSRSKKAPIEHDINFGEDKRKIVQILRMEDWHDDRSNQSSDPR